MMHRNNLAQASPLAMLLSAFSLLLGAAGCSTTPSNIGVGLPSVDPTTGAYLVDTLTLKTSTVLRDSVITSTSQYLLAGRYVDPQLGTIKVNSYTTLALGAAFIPDRTQLADSLVLVFKPDTYRYGDTTKTQTLLEVHELNSFIPLNTYGYASPRLTKADVKPALVNEGLAAPAPRRARSTLGTVRLRLSMPALGNRLMTDAQNGVLITQDNLDANYPGLALLPGATDDASIIRFDATATDAALVLYYHDPIDPTTVLSHAFQFSRHFYQAEPTRTGPLAGIMPSIPLESAKTGEQMYIEGLLGLETKIEIPYLYDLRNYGQHFIITSAVMTAQAPANTLLNRNLPPPAAISVSTTDLNNRVGTTFISSTPYSTAISSIDGIDKAGYSWSMLTYMQNALNNNIPNNGILVNTTTPTSPERVVLGSSHFATNKLQLRVYIIRND